MVRYKLIIFLFVMPFVLNAQSGSSSSFFKIRARNVAVSAAKLSDSAYFEVKKLRTVISDSNTSWSNGSIFKANAHLIAATRVISTCIELIPGQFEPLEQLHASKDKIDLALKKMKILEEEAGSAYGISMKSSILATIKYSSASSYHASMLIKKGEEEPIVTDTISKVREIDSTDYMANRLQTDSVLFNKLLKIYELELLDLMRQEKELITQLENENLSEQDRRILDKELADVRASILERETKIGQGRSQLENLDEEKKLVNNYLTSIAEYEEWDNIEDFPYDLNIELPKGVVYRVQIGYYPIRRKVLFGSLPVDAVKASKKYVRFFTGVHLSYEAAMIVKENVKLDFGIEDAFVVAYLDGKKITVPKANEIVKANAEAEGVTE
jgi:hypothetical protein